MSVGPPPRRISIDSRISSALPIVRPIGRFHVGQHAGHALASTQSDRPHQRAQLARPVDRLHERAAADLAVDHERIDAFGELLGHDRRSNQR